MQETTKEMTKEPGQDTEPKRPGCMRRLVNAGILVLVIAGLVAGSMYFLLYRPLADKHQALSAEMDAAQAELSELRPLVDENGELKADLDRAEIEGMALQALVAVNDARVALAVGDAAEARLPVLQADGVLAVLQTRVDPSQSEAVAGMRERLELARGELDSDRFAAQRDLEVLANTLAQLATDLGGGL